MKKRKSYDTVSETINDLIKRGYDSDFSIETVKNCITCKTTGLSLSEKDFQIDEVYRFEGNSDPGDEMIIFALSSDKYKRKGFIVDAYGTYANTSYSKILKYLHTRLTSK